MQKLSLTRQEYEDIEQKINLDGDEDYAVVAVEHHKLRTYGIHVFARQPSTKEMVKWEETNSKLHMKGSRASVEGSQISAAVNLYDTLIVRAYDVRVGRHVYGDKAPLDIMEARKRVTPIIKREVIREFLGGVMGMTSIEADEEQQESNLSSEDD